MPIPQMSAIPFLYGAGGQRGVAGVTEGHKHSSTKDQRRTLLELFEVAIEDPQGEAVFKASIAMWVSPKAAR